jgi:CreA protein
MLATAICGLSAEEIGSVNTAFNLFKSHSVTVEVLDDPKVGGVSCYYSRARKGGIGGIIGLAEDKSEASVACRQIGEISFTVPLPKQEEVFNVKASLIFKHMRIVRMVDPARNTLIYLVYFDRLIDGSPKNSITAVPIPASTKISLAK